MRFGTCNRLASRARAVDGSSMESSANNSKATAGQKAAPKRAPRPYRYRPYRGRRPPVPKVRSPRSSARRFNDLLDHLTRDLGHEPRDLIEKGVLRQGAALLLRAEQLQAQIAAGGKVGVRVGDQCIRLASEARRLLAALGARAKRPATAPSSAWSPLRSKVSDEVSA
jgi:hypothetical protein